MKLHSSLRLLVALGLVAGGFNNTFAHESSGVTGEQALQRLKQGNARFVSGNLAESSPASIAAARRKVAEKQKPFAIIVGCSDSRVGPEVVFDQKLGDIFVIRTAGEVVDPVAQGSIEYAVAHLGAPLIVVLGHERCGAVSAAVSGAKEPGRIATVLNAIQPAVRKSKGQPGDAVDNAVRAQAIEVATQLRNAGPILNKAVSEGKLKIVAARYDLDTGKVTIIPVPLRKK